MRNLLNPRWIFIINTIPIVILFSIYFGEYTIIKSLLQEENLVLWRAFGAVLAILTLLNFAYAVLLIMQKREVPIWYAVFLLLSYIPFLYVYTYYADSIIPFSIPRWMVQENMLIYVGTFIIPSLAYALFILVTHFTKEGEKSKASKSFLIGLIIPAAFFFFTHVIIKFWRPVETNFTIHAAIILVIIGTMIFLFFLVRSVYIVAIKKTESFSKYHLLWKVPISLVLPAFGLALNNGQLSNRFDEDFTYIFGNFSHPIFYILLVLNCFFICLPNLNSKGYRVLLFIARSVTFSYTFYFFLVFLPFLPLSVIAIIAFGLGFLMLTPLVLFVVHVNEISIDYKFLRMHYNLNMLRVISLVGFFVIPAAITLKFMTDKMVLNEALEYLYTPNYLKSYKLDNVSLSETLEAIKATKKENRNGIFGSRIPYISTYANWLVLDNLTLSENKINKIEKVFFGLKSDYEPRTVGVKDDVTISNISSGSIYDKKQNAWISHIDLELTNNSDSRWTKEYSTSIELPMGCWISDYYLYVGERKEPGILAEKKSAMWVYSQIRNTNRDPGILYYLNGNKVGFQVFPFMEKEKRKTGIEFIHKEPVTISIDNHEVKLGTSNEQEEVSIASSLDSNVIYVSAKTKSGLEKILPKPYYHFLIDASYGKKIMIDNYIERIEKLLNKNLIYKDNARVSFVNAYTKTIELNSDWKVMYSKQRFEGGFYLDRAIKSALTSSYTYSKGAYPIMIVLGDTLENAILDNDYSDFKMASPSSNCFFSLNDSGGLIPHKLFDNSTKLDSTLELVLKNKVIAFPSVANAIAFLPDNNQPEIILKKKRKLISDSQILEKNWQSALTMQGQWITHTFYPEPTSKDWLSLVRNSFRSKVMSPVTSYLVVENEAQKAMLKKKQEQVLSSNQSLDLDEDSQRMPEPNLVILTVILILFLYYKHYKKGTLQA